MREINSDEAWRFIPPEEKFEIMAKAHSKGVAAATMCAVIGATCAAALQAPWFLWITLVGAPFIFQFASGKAWRSLKPAITLRYLAARSVARRYAFSAQAEDLAPRLLFRGTLEPLMTAEEKEADAQVITKQTEVWIALFSDTVIILSEKEGGAALELSHPINALMTVDTVKDEDGHINELVFNVSDKKATRSFHIINSFPAAMVVFEKEYKVFAEKNKEKLLTEGRVMGLQFDEEDEEDGGEY